ncbi:hypothetical protein G6022_03095, partial [Dietzia sp. Cai40]|nr:hypothetical protein [Dietzia sp. Cai40]
LAGAGRRDREEVAARDGVVERGDLDRARRAVDDGGDGVSDRDRDAEPGE